MSRGHTQGQIKERLAAGRELLHQSRRRSACHVVDFRRLDGEGLGIRCCRIATVQYFTDSNHGIDQFAGPAHHRHRLTLTPELKPWLTTAPSHGDVILIERILFGGADRRTLLQQAQRKKGLEKTQLVLIHAHRIEGAHIECPHLDILNTGTLQRLGRTLAGAGHALRSNACGRPGLCPSCSVEARSRGA